MADGTRVTLTDIDVPFWRVAGIIVKWSIAAIPAMIILGLIYFVIAVAVMALFTAIGVHVPQPPTP